jgi:FkbM family methyltransferase
LTRALAPSSGAFTVRNGNEVFSGDLSSLIDRSVYLCGGYERAEIDAFLALVPRRRIALDVGANAGTHSVAFGHAFEKVHAFEPNPNLWAQLERNIEMNDIDATVHRFGLSDTPGQFPLYDTGNHNHGLGTFLEVEQYDRPLRKVAEAWIKVADELGLPDEIDAIKIDVQGFEANVLRGMKGLLARNRPAIWTEIGNGTDLASREDLGAVLPFEFEAYQVRSSGRFVRTCRLEKIVSKLAQGNVFIVPAAE